MGKKVRFCIIGFGNMGTAHTSNLYHDNVPGAEVYAVCDNDPAKLEKCKDLYEDIIRYSDYHEMLKDDNIDAVFVATPHYDHPVIAIDAIKAGKHVLIEKPAGVYTKAVREMNEVAEASDRVFGIMYNQRTKGFYRKVKELVDSGELGEIRRVNWIITNWYRSQSYYDSGGWRATWAGEGGGVLLNQDPHQLDLWQWICGMPKRVRAFCQFGKMHDIEVEDDVTAYMEYDNGATGVFITSTSDTPGTNRLEITGDRGKIVIEDNKVTFWRLRVPEREFNETFTGGFGEPECWKCEIPPAKKIVEDHVGILINFTDAILKGTTLLAPGVEGIHGLTLSNAMHLSSWIDGWVDLPMDEDLYYEKLQQRIQDSKFVKEAKKVTLDVDGTF
ncbi:Gfo/Idh/MocA family oxidoreductase [Vallitalea pronyensis]|uniref:Gfo/Idh/MocA family oxidoreductase n=1 Tax=Vallitalea pronyensis TaxID=1348613 RepID=A0A8J8SJ71_9FIRM|nr:Gfo/Idh/MocA family oxidoreductase [Vallitalea pronyensis]QUI25184.1 Gfo/Idh/MocA family oxidoreductase [Vallitalea pronyensis]